jgi:branched-chain amino acid transport system substrate-binding protein
MRNVIPLSLAVLAVGGGTAQAATVVIATDLPLQGFTAPTQADANRASALLLEQAGGKAGPHSVTIRSYDDSTAEAGAWDDQTCLANGAAHAAAADEVAVMGTYNSGCAKLEVPIMNRAAGGPLAMISGGSVNPGLVRPWEPGEPGKYYPTGIRSFGRVIASDNWQGDAAAGYAKRIHRTQCLVVYDNEPFGAGVARTFRAAAHSRGLRVTGFVRWRTSARNYKALFVRAKRKHPNCVFLSGIADNHGRRLIQDKVRYLGSNARVALIASDGFLGYPEIDGLKVARGLYITTAGLSLDRLRARGGGAPAFLNAFKARFGHEPDSLYAIYEAAAFQLILAAVAASDGTRAGVRAKLFSGLQVPAATSVLGRAFGIDPATGDATLRDLTIVRVLGGQEFDWDTVHV